MLLLGVVWRDHQPHLRVRERPEEPSTLEPVAGRHLGYRVPDPPQLTCVGHVPFRPGRGDYFDCHKPPRPGSRFCERCAIVEATFASNLHHAHTKGSAEIDPAVRKHLDQPNRLYLAVFRDGSIKVGTSTLARADKRLEEQGAWMATFVAETPNGRLIRQLEDAVTEQFGLPQAVSGSRKRRGLISPVDDATLAAQLDEYTVAVTTQLVTREFKDRASVVGEQWRHPMADHPDVVRAIDYPLRPEQGRHDLELITAVGRHLIARRPDGDDAFVVDPMPVFGRWLEVGDYGSDEIAIQDSLF